MARRRRCWNLILVVHLCFQAFCCKYVATDLVIHADLKNILDLRTGVVFPIYKVKTRLQSIPSTDGRGAFAQASEIIKKEGFFNLYRGLQAELAGIGPVKASAKKKKDPNKSN